MNSSWHTLAFGVLLLAACRPAQQAPEPVDTRPVARSGTYRNLFRAIGKTDAEIDAKVDSAVHNFFFGDDSIRVYDTLGTDEAYLYDSGSGDVRTEGVSYGMMIAVQVGLKPQFDKLWTFAQRRMHHDSGDLQGYFAWHTTREGRVLDQGPAPDGEEYFAMALFFAWKRWHDPAYQAAADDILRHMLHQNRFVPAGSAATPMFDSATNQVVFTPDPRGSRFTDPSYHLPAFYELWARWAAEDNDRWRQIAAASRAFFPTAANPVTGLFPDYSRFDGESFSPWGAHGDFRADAWRVIQNLTIDQYWFGADPFAVEEANRLQAFFLRQGLTTHGNKFTLDGTQIEVNHSPGLVAMNAVASLVSTNPQRLDFVRHLWEIQPTRGRYRYYDGCLYLFAMLHLSGRYRMIGFEPGRP